MRPIILLVFGVTLTAAERAQPCLDAGTRDHIRNLMQLGADAALQNHLIRLFEIRMKDSAGSPQRAAKGLQQGVTAYLHTRAAIMAWQPACVL